MCLDATPQEQLAALAIAFCGLPFLWNIVNHCLLDNCKVSSPFLGGDYVIHKTAKLKLSASVYILLNTFLEACLSFVPDQKQSI